MGQDEQGCSWRILIDLGPSLCVTTWLSAFFFLFFFFFLEEEALHVSLICQRSNISGQLKETSGMKAYTARPTTGEAALPWQATRM